MQYLNKEEIHPNIIFTLGICTTVDDIFIIDQHKKIITKVFCASLYCLWFYDFMVLISLNHQTIRINSVNLGKKILKTQFLVIRIGLDCALGVDL